MRTAPTLDEWVAQVCDALDLPPVDRDLVLDLARDVAHGVARPAAPLTTFLLGLGAGSRAAAAGSDLRAAVQDADSRIRALLPEPGEAA